MSRERRIWKDLAGIERHTSALLEKRNPYLVWDRIYHGSSAQFFQNPVGQYRQGPDEWRPVATWEDTNLTLAGMLGMPTIFEVEEVRFYPGNATATVVDRWRRTDWRASVMKSDFNVDHLRLVPNDHLPLPDVDDFSLKEREGGRVSLQERAQPLIDIVNRNRLPCLVAGYRRTYYSIDLISVNLETLSRVDPSLSSYAVLVGSVWLNV